MGHCVGSEDEVEVAGLLPKVINELSLLPFRNTA